MHARPIPAGLLTPLGAYLRLRGDEGGGFLLESVERGRLGGNSFVGHRRGPYAGAVGYVLPVGTMDTCALRTIVVSDGIARLQAGAGVVTESQPEAEHRECLAKFAALEKAIDVAEAEYVA